MNLLEISWLLVVVTYIAGRNRSNQSTYFYQEVRQEVLHINRTSPSFDFYMGRYIRDYCRCNPFTGYLAIRLDLGCPFEHSQRRRELDGGFNCW